MVFVLLTAGEGSFRDDIDRPCTIISETFGHPIFPPYDSTTTLVVSIAVPQVRFFFRAPLKSNILQTTTVLLLIVYSVVACALEYIVYDS